MSDFTSPFWSWWVIVLTVGSIGYCAFLLFTTKRIKAKGAATDKQPVGTTGHSWDGDLVELNNPLPRWWVWLFWITIIFSVVYLALYPGLGSVRGLLDWSSSGAYAKERESADARLKPLYDKYLAMDVAQIAADPAGRAIGERIFLNNCAPCHGSDAGGSRGFPNLRDKDWLYGGAPENIIQSITDGRMGVMPPMGAALGEEGVKDVVAYVRSLSGLPHDSLKSQLGKPLFAQSCAACHGADGTGNQAIGAPNLTDNIWLYGSSEAVITEGVMKGRHIGIEPEHSPMPSFKSTFDPARIKLVAAYVWSLSNPAAAK